MGTGKTAVGKEVAQKMEWQFLDLDDLIELREKRRIADIFAKDGEPYFRKVEKKVLREVSKQKNFVVACGGGIVIDKDNIKTMKDSGVMICLSASPDIILKRTQGHAHRPLLNVKDPKKQIDLLMKMRSPFYGQADYTIDTSKLSIKQVALKVLRISQKKK